jgi:hypothetical protein
MAQSQKESGRALTSRSAAVAARHGPTRIIAQRIGVRLGNHSTPGLGEPDSESHGDLELQTRIMQEVQGTVRGAGLGPMTRNLPRARAQSEPESRPSISGESLSHGYSPTESKSGSGLRHRLGP